ncbi:MAG TPA: hypothetical protein VMR70_04820 [Flavisolibacter sp.]|nr:hypothetical protein [Flavisolibacter sp.]
MRNLFTTFFAVALSLSLSFCTADNKPKSAEPSTSALAPQFRDKGMTMDSLQSVYNFASVEYENWEDDDATDSSLTVSFINSTKLPPTEIEASVKEFTAIASSIHRSIADTSKYKSYYIIFVKRDTIGNLVNGSHTAGMDVSVREF